jgi:hypothetical protein
MATGALAALVYLLLAWAEHGRGTYRERLLAEDSS